MQRKKVIQFIFALNDGGAETLVKDYAMLLDNSKYEVIILTVQSVKGTANYKAVTDSGIRVISIFENMNFFNKIVSKFFKKLYIPYKLKRILKTEKIDCIHVHLSLLKYLKPIASELENIKLFYTCHSLPEKFFDNDKDNYKAAVYLIEHCNLRIIALHEKMKEDLNAIFHIDNTIVIRNGVDFEKYKQINDKSIRNELELFDDNYIIGHVGRFSVAKNHMFLLDIFNSLLKRKPNAKLLLVGSGQLKESVVNKAKELNIFNKIVFLEHRTDIPQILSIMDVFLFPSIYEGFPVSLVEAQVAGLKCVVSNNITSEAYLQEKTISLDITQSPDEWVDVILDDLIRREEYGDIEKYNLRKEIIKLENLYS